MSDGAKIGLILGGTAAVAYFLFFRTSSAPLPLATTPATTGSPLGPAPGAPISTGVATAVKAGLGGVAALATLPISTVTKVGSTLYGLDKKVLTGAYNAAKSVDSAVVGAVESAGKSIYHGIASIF